MSKYSFVIQVVHCECPWNFNASEFQRDGDRTHSWQGCADVNEVLNIIYKHMLQDALATETSLQ